jgi:hypothetical protein
MCARLLAFLNPALAPCNACAEVCFEALFCHCVTLPAACSAAMESASSADAQAARLLLASLTAAQPDAAAVVRELAARIHSAAASGSTEALALCCGALAEAVVRVAAGAERAVALGAADALFAALRARRSSALVQLAGIAALGAVVEHASEGDVRAIVLSSLGFVEIATAALEAHPADAAVQAAACYALLVAAAKSGDGGGTRFAGALVPTLSALQRHCASERVVLAAAALLCKLLEGEPAKATAASLGGAEALVAVLTAHPEHEHIQMHALGALDRLCDTSSARAAAAVRAGALPATVAALRAHAATQGVAAQGVAAFGSDVSRMLCANTVERAAFGTLGGVAALAAAMKAHPENAQVQATCSVALDVFCNLLPDNQAKAHAAGAVQLIAAALTAFRADADTLYRLTGALASVCFDRASNIATAADCSAVEALIDGMRAHPADYGVQKQVIRVLGVLATIPPDAPPSSRPTRHVCTKAAHAGAFGTIVAAMQVHPAKAGLQFLSCLAVGNICCDDENRLKAGAAGAINAVIAALRRHGADAGVQRYGCMAIQYLTKDLRVNQTRAARDGALAAAMQAMRTHAADAAVVYAGAGALCNVVAVPVLLSALWRCCHVVAVPVRRVRAVAQRKRLPRHAGCFCAHLPRRGARRQPQARCACIRQILGRLTPAA